MYEEITQSIYFTYVSVCFFQRTSTNFFMIGRALDLSIKVNVGCMVTNPMDTFSSEVGALLLIVFKILSCIEEYKSSRGF